MKAVFSFFLIFIAVNFVNGQGLAIPIEGVYGVDYIIVNYPDWHGEDGPILVEDGYLNDHKCGSKTYDGHQGTDFVIRGFTQMDSSVRVLAAADGEVIHVTEDLFDRETEGIVAYGLGNYVGIYHASSNTYSYYAHLKTNSVIVALGDLVSAGQFIAEVGSSGNSTDPHLHFELWNPGVLADPTIDPWGIPCDSGSTRWTSPPLYDTSYAVWEYGMVNYDSVANFVPSTWVPLKERLDLKDNFTSDDPFFTFWALQYGLKIGDETTIEWYEPNGDLYASETVSYLTRDWWFHYFSHSIPTPPLSKQGLWTIRYYYNDSLQLTKPFTYGHLSNQENKNVTEQLIYYQVDQNTVLLILPKETAYTHLFIFDFAGRTVIERVLNGNNEIQISLPNSIKPGVYLLSLIHEEKRFSMKIVLN